MSLKIFSQTEFGLITIHADDTKSASKAFLMGMGDHMSS
jgi:hypothetical protein